MKTQKPSIIELQEKIEVVAAISFEVLNLASAKDLKEYAKYIVPNSSKLAKEDLIKGLLEVTLSARQKLIKADELKQVELATEAEKDMIAAYQERLNKESMLNTEQLPDSVLIALDSAGNVTNDETNATNLGVRLYKEIKLMVNLLMSSRGGKFIPTQLGGIAARTASLEKSNYPVITTRKSRRTDYLKALEACFQQDVATPFPDTLKDTIQSFKSIMYAAFHHEVVGSNREYKISVDNNNESRQEFDAATLFNIFLKVLETPEKFKWTEIVKALAFFTGRRTSEILCSAEFTVVDNHHLSFKGQAKRRQNFNPDESFTIPTLVDTGLIMAAFNYLIGKGKRQLYNVNDHQGSLEMCSKKTGKELSRSYNDYTAKDYRAMYGELTYLVYAPNKIGQTKWLTNVLGHGESAAATTSSYVKFFLPDEKVESFKNLVLSN